MNTSEIMKLSLDLAGLKKVPQDSATYVRGKGIKKILFGIDAAAPELLLARHLDCDAVIAHHPTGGSALIKFHEVFTRHVQQMVEAGIPKAEAEKAAAKKHADLEVDGHARNYGHAIDFARLLKMPYMNIHTPLDEIGRKTMKDHIAKRIRRNSNVQDVVCALNELPEFANADTEIKIRMGKAENPCGKVVVSHAAGTNGGYEIAKTYFKHGIGTVIYIHVGLGDLEKLKAEGKGNLLVTGHIASDSVGINPFLRKLRSQDISVTTLGVVAPETR